MRTINYKEAISESVEELRALEKAQTNARLRDRVRFIRLLKEGQALTQAQAGERVGLQRRQSQVLWKTYRTHGLAGLLTSHYHGSWAKLSSQQQARLLQRLDGHDIATQQQLIAWVEAEMGITYSQSGMSMLLSRLQVKLKTGRPVHVQKDVAGELVFKKSFPS